MKWQAIELITPMSRVRITSKKSYDKGLFIIDVQSMPYGPAVWLVVTAQRREALLTSSMTQASLLVVRPQLAIRRYYLNNIPLISHSSLARRD